MYYYYIGALLGMCFAVYGADEVTMSLPYIGGAPSHSFRAVSFLDEELPGDWYEREEAPVNMCSRLLSFFCCGRLKNYSSDDRTESEPLLHDNRWFLSEEQHYHHDQSSELVLPVEQCDGESRDKELWLFLRLRGIHADAIGAAVSRGADPYGRGTDVFDSTSIPLLYVVDKLNEDHAHINEWSRKLHALLLAHAMNQSGASSKANVDKIQHILKNEIGKFGLRQSDQSFEEYGFLWGKICTLLGLNICDLRIGVFPLLQKDASEENAYKVRKALQVRFGAFEKFGMACAVNDFMNCLVSSLMRGRVYDMNAFCTKGIIRSVSDDNVLEYIVHAERIRADLNESARYQVQCKIALITQQGQ
jgi:hypothetical protein